MRALTPFVMVIALVLLAFAGIKTANLHFLFGVVIPYAALGTFIIGVVYRVLNWGSSPVPFRIPTTCGQEKSLPWIKQNKIDNPSSSLGVIMRMAFEVLLFRSLFRNMKTELKSGKVVYGSEKWLWVAGLAFHWSFLIILIRHFRCFIENVPFVFKTIEGLDSFLQIGVPLFYITEATSGVLMRYFYKVHIVGVKILTMGLISFNPDPKILNEIGTIFYVHLFLISVLLAYFPFSKLMHMGGVFLSPTRNLANNNRMERHTNPWDYPVEVHTYEEYENDFRDKMKKAGIPVEKE
ncbi:MAG: respiratory nitrate reductase subunit gamma [Nitrospirae bacterium]|nr:respiratory nitrate reductase subunit gamma [Nitrospirota bacterium]